MKLLNIDQGIARLTESGDVELLDTPYSEIGQSICEGALETLRSAVVKSTHALIDVNVLSPVSAPPRFVIVGLNYQSHADMHRSLHTCFTRPH